MGHGKETAAQMQMQMPCDEPTTITTTAERKSTQKWPLASGKQRDWSRGAADTGNKHPSQQTHLAH